MRRGRLYAVIGGALLLLISAGFAVYYAIGLITAPDAMLGRLIGAVIVALMWVGYVGLVDVLGLRIRRP